jgi:hypothetical protein
MMDDSDQHRDKRQRIDGDKDEEADQMEVEPLRHATNHDRQDVITGGSITGGIQRSGGSRDEAMLEQLEEETNDFFLLSGSSKALLSDLPCVRLHKREY